MLRLFQSATLFLALVSSVLAQAGTATKDITLAELNMTFVWFGPETFTIGTDAGEKDEGPITQVTLKRPFWVAKTEMTQAQWKKIMGTTVAQLRDRADKSWPLKGEGDDYPIYYVSWEDALNCARKLTARERAAGRLLTGYEYTLPTEAQWELACRRGSKTELPRVTEFIAWYENNSKLTTHPVAKKKPNPSGLYDMQGNVWEWCLDWYGKYPGGSLNDPSGADWGANRVTRGGSWANEAEKLRVTFRDGAPQDSKNSNVGFRLVLAPVVRKAP